MDAAARINPLGCPSSNTLRVVILTESSLESDREVQDCSPEVLIFMQNVLIILWASLIRFLRASGEGITTTKFAYVVILYEEHLHLNFDLGFF